MSDMTIVIVRRQLATSWNWSPDCQPGARRQREGWS
jgi:hypothetical protein